MCLTLKTDVFHRFHSLKVEILRKKHVFDYSVKDAPDIFIRRGVATMWQKE